MKTTVKLTPSKAISVEPCKAGGVLATLEFSAFGIKSTEALNIKADQFMVFTLAGLKCLSESERAEFMACLEMPEGSVRRGFVQTMVA